MGSAGVRYSLGTNPRGPRPIGPEVDMAAGSPLLCPEKEAVANWEGNPADVHIIFIPFHRLSSSFMPFYVSYCPCQCNPPLSNLTQTLSFSMCVEPVSLLLPQNVYTVDTMFICFLACNFLCVFYISK